MPVEQIMIAGLVFIFLVIIFLGPLGYLDKLRSYIDFIPVGSVDRQVQVGVELVRWDIVSGEAKWYDGTRWHKFDPLQKDRDGPYQELGQKRVYEVAAGDDLEALYLGQRARQPLTLGSYSLPVLNLVRSGSDNGAIQGNVLASDASGVAGMFALSATDKLTFSATSGASGLAGSFSATPHLSGVKRHMVSWRDQVLDQPMEHVYRDLQTGRPVRKLFCVRKDRQYLVVDLTKEASGAC